MPKQEPLILILTGRDLLYFVHDFYSNPRRFQLEELTELGTGIAHETLEKVPIRTFCPAVGNGSSLLGPLQGFLEAQSDISVYPFETVQSAVAYDLLHLGKYEEMFGIKPGTLSRHQLPGTSFQGIDFPHISHSIPLIDDVILVSDKRIDAEYETLTGRTTTRELPHWDTDLTHVGDLGRTTRAGITVALHLIKKLGLDDILVLAYDKSERYDE